MVDRFLENAVLCETVLYETQGQYNKGGLRSENLLKTNFGWGVKTQNLISNPYLEQILHTYRS